MWLYQCIWASQELQGQQEAALKTCLKLYYQIEPAQVPAVDPADHQNTLYHLANNFKKFGRPISDIPKGNMGSIYKHLRKLYAKNAVSSRLFPFILQNLGYKLCFVCFLREMGHQCVMITLFFSRRFGQN
jgi:hypothetical protein